MCARALGAMVRMVGSLVREMIGLIVNPVSSKDIRRLVALGRVVTVEEKANLVARFLAGLADGPQTEVRALDDAAGVARRAVQMAAASAGNVTWLPIDPTGTEADTVAAAAALGEEGADLVAVVGGDGTLRATVEGWDRAPLLLLPAGTNNAFASPVEPTVAGLAAAHAGRIDVREAALVRRLRLVVDRADETTTAVVDVVGVRESWVAARALWRPADLLEAVVTRADPSAVGMAAVAATFGSLDEGYARYLRFGDGRRVRAAFGPGLVIDLSVTVTKELSVGEQVTLDPETGVVALDGERRVLGEGACHVVPRWGPTAFDPAAALAVISSTPDGRF